jgi:hypothetical protein
MCPGGDFTTFLTGGVSKGIIDLSMKKLFLLLMMVSAACSKEEIDRTTCSVEATVRDLTQLDGCGFVFELNDGTRLEPQRLFYCGTPPLPKEVTDDPLFNFQFVDGKKVKIAYQPVSALSICMVGSVVKITCLTEMAVSDF